MQKLMLWHRSVIVTRTFLHNQMNLQKGMLQNTVMQESSGHEDTVDSSFDGHYSGSENDYELQNIDEDQYMYDRFSESNDSYVTDTDEDSENDNEANVPDLAADLVGWATNNECTRSGMNDLLDILR